jgi:septal ring factor EnvC (AmiA/AmiB activator)
MSASDRIHRRLLAAAAATAAVVASGLLVAGSATGASVNQLQNKLNSTQSQLSATQSHQNTIAGSISVLNGQVSSLASHINLVQSRVSEAEGQLTHYDTQLSETKSELSAERMVLRALRIRLKRAQRGLAAELVSQYEQPEQSFMSLVVNARGFNELLTQLQYLNSAKRSEQHVIKQTRAAWTRAQAATARIDKLEVADEQAASAAQTQASALTGINNLLASQQAALDDERAAENTALAASQAKGSQLQSAIKQIQQQEAAAQQAAQNIGASGGSSGSGSGGGGLGASAGWAIPYAIVLCESGGQNLPPNSAGASGYYQIIPGTWKDFGGTGPQAYLASKAEQDAVASRIWDGGKGASNWTCASIVGIT